ncbi:RHS repeat-associated core domain-containing protein [Pseudomonas sp. REP124]|uniref:RHS repeat-associated core domain-containing protein n=1 Tax=Pseudomonas sp. REP124 TaxID=2875731 RepID=UPI001CCFDE4C|nr:RHS repeat-associated core domain-containing protein [Pseudomonas sp. REP124]MBZ9784787.1 RHS repeat-associated core domain-containing protein [Pseudomonas sp. REP124]
MPASHGIELCHYFYDPLDRLIETTTVNGGKLRRFYCKDRLTTEIQGGVKRTVFQQSVYLLAQLNRKDDSDEISFLATDEGRSVLQVINNDSHVPLMYSAYGYDLRGGSYTSLLKFNGDRSDSVTGNYSLGNGCRVFSPLLMRFISPDRLSPFERGGLNSYVYCLGDPINRSDETGQYSLLKSVLSLLGLRKKPELFDLRYDPEFRAMLHEEFMSTKHKEVEPTIRIIRNRKDFEYIGPGGEAKFVLTKSGKLITGKLWDYAYRQKNNIEGAFYLPHHGSLVANQKSKQVISAGYIRVERFGEVVINNHSGHYNPTFESLSNVKKYLEKNNISNAVKLIRFDNKA